MKYLLLILVLASCSTKASFSDITQLAECNCKNHKGLLMVLYDEDGYLYQCNDDTFGHGNSKAFQLSCVGAK